MSTVPFVEVRGLSNEVIFLAEPFSRNGLARAKPT
jgi:hypothetical protein